MGLPVKLFRTALVAVFAATTLAVSPIFISGAHASHFDIDRARWDNEDNRLVVRGSGENNESVTVTNADTGALIGTDRVDSGDWRVRVSNLSSVPCRVRAVQSDGQSDERDVSDAPADCDDGGGQPPGNNAPVAGDDSYSTTVDVQLNVPAPGVLNNDSDADGDPLIAVEVSGAANGTASLNADLQLYTECRFQRC